MTFSHLIFPNGASPPSSGFEKLRAGIEEVRSGGVVDPILVECSSVEEGEKFRREVELEVLRARGVFVPIKFISTQKFTANEALDRLLEPLACYLAEAEDLVLLEQIKRELGVRVAILAGTCSRLGQVFSTPSMRSQGDPVRTENQLAYAAAQFLAIFARMPKPVVLFYDGLQWADSMSLRVLRLATELPDAQRLILAGAYASQEAKTQVWEVPHRTEGKPLDPFIAFTREVAFREQLGDAGVKKTGALLALVEQGRTQCLENGTLDLYSVWTVLSLSLQLVWCRSVAELSALSEIKIPFGFESHWISKTFFVAKTASALLQEVGVRSASRSPLIEATERAGFTISELDLFFEDFIHFLNGEFGRIDLQHALRLEGAHSLPFSPVLDFVYTMAFFRHPKSQKAKRVVANAKKRLRGLETSESPELRAMAFQILAEGEFQKSLSWRRIPWMAALYKTGALAASQEAVELARESGGLWLEAVISERAAHFSEVSGVSGSESLARLLSERSFDCWVGYGASFRVAALIERRPAFKGRLFGRTEASIRFSNHSTLGTSSSLNRSSYGVFSSSHSVQKNLTDFQSILKTVRGFSTEIDLGSLLKGLLGAIFENSRAARVQVFLLQGNQWFLEASEKRPEQPVVCQHLPLKTLTLAFQQALLQAQASKQLQNTQDGVILPISHKGQVRALICLAGQSAANEFPSQTIEAIRLLVSQTAVSIENALLYQSLERRVSERTKKVKAILQNIQQGILIIDSTGRVSSGYSQSCFGLLDEKDEKVLEKQDALTLLLSTSSLSADEVTGARSAFNASMGCPSDQFNTHSQHLPSRLSRRNRVLRLDWNPMLNSQNQVEKIMVVIRDVTHLLELDRQAREEEEKLSSIGEILRATHERFSDFLSEAERVLEMIEGKNPKSESGLSSLQALKLTSITLGLKKISSLLEKIESKPEEGIGELGARIKHYRFVDSMYLEPFRSGMKTGLKVEAPRDQSIQSLLSAVSQTLPELAEELGKAVPELTFEGKTDVLFPLQTAVVLRDCLNHCIRNCLDHGIESPDERRVLGKPDAGKITVRVESQTKVIIWDDGRGLDLQHLKTKRPDLKSDEELGELIFGAGISTARKVTSISGRGVGLDAVRSFLLERGGAVSLEWLGPRGKNEFRPFRMILELGPSVSLGARPEARAA